MTTDNDVYQLEKKLAALEANVLTLAEAVKELAMVEQQLTAVLASAVRVAIARG